MKLQTTTKGWQNITAKDRVGYYELKQHRPWFNEECSKLLNQWKQNAR
jgi:hypothetical protein